VGKFHRTILTILGGILALGVVVLLTVNLYVQSHTTQAKIQHELSQRLGAPIQIRQISVTPWGGLKLSGITIPQTAAERPGDFLNAKTFRLRLRFFSLFTKRLVIKEVSLIEPTVVWPQNSEGKWRLPARGAKPEPDTKAEPVPSASELTAQSSETPGLPGVSPIASTEPALTSPLSEQKQFVFSVVPEIERVNVKHGTFTFLDRQGRLIGNFEGVDFRSSVRSATSIRGNARVAKMSLRDRFFLERLQSPFSYEPDVLEMSKISASVAGGEIIGHFAMQPEAEDSPFSLNMNFRNVQADQLLSDAGGPRGMVQGKLEGNLDAAGKSADPDALTGKGEIFLREGQVRQYSLLVALGQILQIEELTQLQLEQAEAKYHVASGLVTIDEMVLRSPNIRLSSTGTITLAGKLKLESQLVINEKIRGQLFKIIRENFQKTNEPGYYALDFQVNGTVDHPKTNLVDRMVGRSLKDMVDSVFGGGKPKKKKREAEPSPTEEMASPAPTPNDDARTTPPR
jgi:type II secretion system protein N